LETEHVAGNPALETDHVAGNPETCPCPALYALFYLQLFNAYTSLFFCYTGLAYETTCIWHPIIHKIFSLMFTGRYPDQSKHCFLESIPQEIFYQMNYLNIKLKLTVKFTMWSNTSSATLWQQAIPLCLPRSVMMKYFYTPQVKGIQLSVGKTAETEKKNNGIDKC